MNITKEQQDAIYWLMHEPLLAMEEGCRDPHRSDLDSMRSLLPLLNKEQQRELLKRIDDNAADVKSAMGSKKT